MNTTLKNPPSLTATRFCPPVLLYQMMNRPLDFLMEAGNRHDVVKLGWIGAPLFLVNEPELIKQMLTDTRGFHKGKIFKRLEMVLGKGLITLDGDDWVEARRRVQQAFRPGLFAEQQQIVVRHTQQMIQRLQRQAVSGVVDLAPVSSELMLRIALELLFGASPESIDMDQTRTDVEICNDYVKRRVWSFTPESWQPSRRREFQHALKGLESIVERVIEQRRGETQTQRQKRCDVLSLLCEAGFSGASLRDHVMTMLIAGHETTATAISFAFALLSRHAEVQNRLYDEVKTLPSSGFPLEQAPYTGAVWSESMRLYPAVPFLDRTAVHEAVLGPYRIPSGANLLWSPYCIHRKYWSSPEVFDPQRFLDGAKLPRTNFIPFGIGPRTCIGKPLADMEGVTVASLFVQAFEIESADPGKLEVRPMITLQPKHGVKVHLRARPALSSRASLCGGAAQSGGASQSGGALLCAGDSPVVQSNNVHLGV